jgi:hypothetical protein
MQKDNSADNILVGIAEFGLSGPTAFPSPSMIAQCRRVRRASGAGERLWLCRHSNSGKANLTIR